MRPKPFARRRIRPGLVLRRHPRLRWALVGLAAVVTGASIAHTVEQADRAEAAWGTPRSVVIVTRDLLAGTELDGSNTDVVDRPAAVVPEGALATRPEGRTRLPVLAGEVLLDAHLAPAGTSALVARLPVGARAVAIPAEPGTTPGVTIGDAVDVLVALAPDAAGSGPPGFAVARRALVVDVTDAAVTVAVRPDEAPRIAVALGQGAVTLALVGAE